MTHREQIRAFLSDKNPLVVGAIADQESLSAPLTGCNVVELRLDSLGTGPKVLNFARNSPLPILVTARGPAEGGQSNWTLEERASAYQTLMPFASLIDIELHDLEDLHQVTTRAKNENVIVVGSFHDFKNTPAYDKLLSKFDHQPDLFKFALMANSPDDIRSHLRLLQIESHGPLSVMGMGPLGAAARPLMAKAGSLLNYGFIGKTPTAPNQWPASLLGDALLV